MARCHLCSTLAGDPGKGPSPWKRAVIAGEQVLVCPRCQQRRPDWLEGAESCPSCGSKKLRKALGDRICGGCGHQWSDEDFSLD